MLCYPHLQLRILMMTGDVTRAYDCGEQEAIHTIVAFCNWLQPSEHLENPKTTDPISEKTALGSVVTWHYSCHTAFMEVIRMDSWTDTNEGRSWPHAQDTCATSLTL